MEIGIRGRGKAQLTLRLLVWIAGDGGLFHQRGKHQKKDRFERKDEEFGWEELNF